MLGGALNTPGLTPAADGGCSAGGGMPGGKPGGRTSRGGGTPTTHGTKTTHHKTNTSARCQYKHTPTSGYKYCSSSNGTEN